MPSQTSVPQRRSHEDSDEDDSDSSHPTSGPNIKRQRLSPTEEATRGGNDSNDDDDDDDDNQSETSEDMDAAGARAIAQQPVVDHGVGPGGYKPGAIVRIKVTNFVTYTSAEFFPGPKLNMVIGPNGTGKSTLVCAICLGLGWGPQHLGRAKDVGEFVKHGCSEAKIEIELAGRPKLSFNPVITRTIKRDGNKNVYTLNRAPSGWKEVRKLAQSFAIQVDNLCQFLPQDKVSEFAALTPIELLHSTQRAVAGPEMVEWHNGLKTFRSEQKQVEIDSRADREMLKNLEDRQESQREVVQRMRERDVIKQKMELLEFIRPVVEYRDYHAEFIALKERKAAIDQAYDRLKLEVEPALRSINAKQEYSEQITAAKQHRKEQVEKLSRIAETRGKKIEDLKGSIKALDNDIEAERKSGQKHKQEATNASQTIARLKREYEDEPVEFDPDHYNERLREKRLEKRELDAKAEEMKARRAPWLERGKALKSKIAESEQQLEHLDSAIGKQEFKLKLTNSNTKSLGPPMVTCSVPDPKYADVIESLFHKSDYTVFTVQSRNDFRTLQRNIAEQKLADISIKTCSQPLGHFTAPDFDIQSLGFDGWANDFLTGPDPVIAMLCMENRLNQTPVGLREISEEAFAQMENGSLNSWVSGKHSYNVTRRREYGPGAQSTRVRQVKPAQAWTAKPADASVKQRYLDDIRQSREELAELQAKVVSDKAAAAELIADHRRVQDEYDNIESEKSEKQTAHTNWRSIPDRLVQHEQRQKTFTDLFEKVRERVYGHRNRQDEISIERAKATIEYSDAAEKLRQAYEELMKAEMRHLEANSDLQTLKIRESDVTKMLEEKRLESVQVSNEYKEGTKKGRIMLAKAKQTTSAIKEKEGGAELLDSIREDGYNTDQLNADIDSKRAELEFTHGGNESMIQEFEQRERQIDKLQSKLGELNKKLSDYSEAINELRQKWEPVLDALVSKISHAFSDSFARIGCAGQCTLEKVRTEAGPNNDPPAEYEYDQWAIEIHVKFRESEELALLNAYRQSGGERAVSTIFYLMALQSLSASPFRVVDEINQGMDPRNERMVHGRLVDIACASSNGETDEEGNVIGGGGGGQYFLITPKLLNGLSYKPGMQVLCIYSGEHMPENYAKLNFGLAIRNMKTIVAESGRSTGKNQARAIADPHQVDVYT
ncbi:hypothetical protein N7481_007756 [Penicillium waksmanii]|uniref:uncharacterized protein n=1 Tax=Penicillium waksmanii TaxID=69791 RepID=UPI002547E9F4|nr:uncharacterized protein N7481_007756 [Penicillium waksmanii]KAJ5980458.1 hypothetical protein N7481_007756 [Penicillium waksmanii]